jgi:hypothetical protein
MFNSFSVLTPFVAFQPASPISTLAQPFKSEWGQDLEHLSRDGVTPVLGDPLAALLWF